MLVNYKHDIPCLSTLSILFIQYASNKRVSDWRQTQVFTFGFLFLLYNYISIPHDDSNDFDGNYFGDDYLVKSQGRISTGISFVTLFNKF